MGDIYRVELDYASNESGPPSVVVKLPSSFEENRQQGVARACLRRSKIL